MYHNILVPMALDHGISHQTLKIARNLVSPEGQITALHVFEIPKGSVSAYMGEDIIQKGDEKSCRLLKEKTAHIEGITTDIIRSHPYAQPRLCWKRSQSHSPDPSCIDRRHRLNSCYKFLCR